MAELSPRPAPVPYLAARQSEDGGWPSEGCDALLLGAPLDLTETFRSGAHGGPHAVRVMSDALETYSPTLDLDLEDIHLVDAGDVPLEGLAMDEAIEAIAHGTARAASLARVVVLLGGEHTASLGGVLGMARHHPDLHVLHLDAHLDYREAYEGERLTHASWLYHAASAIGSQRIFQFGLRSGERAEWMRARRQVAWCGTDLALPADVRARLEGRPLYVTVDIDVLDPAHAPGTGCPEPGGVTFRDLAAFLYGLEGLNVVALDVMEVSPNLDPASITAAAGAKVVREAVLLFSGRPGARE